MEVAAAEEAAVEEAVAVELARGLVAAKHAAEVEVVKVLEGAGK